MNLRHTLKLVHQLLDLHRIDHALIGGLALACFGSTRSTMDLDLIVPEQKKLEIKQLLTSNGFEIFNETLEVMQFKGLGLVNILFARRPMAEEILRNATPGGPEGIKFIQPEDLIGLKNMPTYLISGR